MIPPPVSPGLYLCDYVIVEENTRKVSLIANFVEMELDEFPSVADCFSVFSTLKDGFGDCLIRLVVGQPHKAEILYQREIEVNFPDKLAEIYVHFRVPDCQFPEPGLYEFTLLVDNE